MDTEQWQAHRTSFGPAADLYDRIRPTYPAEAIAWMLGTQSLRVVDLGAGTGKLSRVLRDAGHEVIAVEPDLGMLKRLAETSPGVTPAAGSAEQIPVEPASVDAVVAGQAYHWFDVEKAHPEIARVLRPGGIFSPIWNIRDDSESWVGQMSELLGSQDGSNHAGNHGLELPAEFGPVERGEFRHGISMDPDALVTLVKSRSYYLTATPDRQAELEAGIRDLCRSHPDLAGRDSFELPYLTVAYKAGRR
ncbi:MAG: class I SAM-dependent methyltransferase [Actinocatenispora sp.]